MAGDHVQAEERTRGAVATAESETDNVWLQGWSKEDLALVLERAGRIEEARHALERALAVWERKRCLPYVTRVREQLHSLRRAQVCVTLERHLRALGMRASRIRWSTRIPLSHQRRV